MRKEQKRVGKKKNETKHQWIREEKIKIERKKESKIKIKVNRINA